MTTPGYPQTFSRVPQLGQQVTVAAQRPQVMTSQSYQMRPQQQVLPQKPQVLPQQRLPQQVTQVLSPSVPPLSAPSTTLSAPATTLSAPATTLSAPSPSLSATSGACHVGQPLAPQPVPCVAPAPAQYFSGGLPVTGINTSALIPRSVGAPPAISTPTMTYRQPVMSSGGQTVTPVVRSVAATPQVPTMSQPLAAARVVQSSSFEPPLMERRLSVTVRRNSQSIQEESPSTAQDEAGLPSWQSLEPPQTNDPNAPGSRRRRASSDRSSSKESPAGKGAARPGAKAGAKAKGDAAKRDRLGSKEFKEAVGAEGGSRKNSKLPPGALEVPADAAGDSDGGIPSPSLLSPSARNERNEHGDRGEGSAEAVLALQAAQGVDGRTLVVFDFDRTIMKEHMWKKYKDTDISKIKISDDHFCDLHKFRALVFSIRQKGHNVAVATFGRRDVVDKALHYALGKPHEVSIRTPADFGHKDGSGILGNKNTHLANLAERFQVAADKIILVDDDKHNIDAAAEAGVQGHWVPDGLGESMVEHIANTVGVEPMDPRRAAEFATEAAKRAKKLDRRMGRRDTGPPTEVLMQMKKIVDEGGEHPEFEPVEVSSSDEGDTTPGGTQKPSARLQSAFAAYSNDKDEMDSKNFARFCTECKLLDTKLKKQECDILFAKIAPRAGQCMKFADFEASLELIGKAKGVETEAVVAAICDQGRLKRDQDFSLDSPQKVVTSSNVVRTVAKMPAPTKVVNPASRAAVKTTPRDSTRETPSRATSSTTRTTREAVPASPGSGTRRTRTSAVGSPAGETDAAGTGSQNAADAAKPRRISAGSTSATTRQVTRTSAVGAAAAPQAAASRAAAGSPSAPVGLQEVFDKYAVSGQMDARSFARLCKECKLLDRKLSSTDVDLIVAKALPKGARKLSFDSFDTALGLVAQKKGMDGRAMQQAICGLQAETSSSMAAPSASASPEASRAPASASPDASMAPAA